MRTKLASCAVTPAAHNPEGHGSLPREPAALVEASPDARTASPGAPSRTALRARGVTTRVLLVAFLLAPANSFFVLFMSYERNIFDPTLIALFWNVLFGLVLLRLVNQALLRWRPEAAFSPGELLALWVLMAVATSGSGMDSMQCTFMTMQGASRFASPENHWQDLFVDKIPLALTVQDPGALDRLWLGESSLLDARNLHVWAGPVFRWWLLMSALWCAPIGLAHLLRRRWIEQEKMGFPIVQLPFEIAQRHPRFLNQSVFWIAVAAPAALNLLNGFHTYYPQVPSFPTAMWDERLNIGRFLVGLGRPWDAAGGMFYTCLYPFMLGLGLLLPAELSLSLWFFYLFWRVEMIIAAWLGFQQSWDAPYTVAAGGYLALVGFPLWSARSELVRFWRGAMRGESRREAEPLSDRAALITFLAGYAFVVWMAVANKLSLWSAVAFFGQYFLMATIIGRIRAEMGLPTHELERMGPAVLQGTILGPRVLGLQNLTSLTALFGFTRGMRNIPFPSQLEGLYFASRTGLDGRRLLLATGPFISLGLAWGWFWTLVLSYYRGLGTYRGSFHTWFAGEAWYQLAGWIGGNAPVAWGRVLAGGTGFLGYWAVMALRSRWVAWPLHPAGFALSTTWYMAHIWFPMFMAWGLKTAAARWGGFRAVRALPLVAYGLILGDVGTGALWIIYAMVAHVPAYAFWQ